jgi:hypothetical protein
MNLRAIVLLEELSQLKKFSDLIGTLTRHLPACSIVPQPHLPACSMVPQPTTLPRALFENMGTFKYFGATVGNQNDIFHVGNESMLKFFK